MFISEKSSWVSVSDGMQIGDGNVKCCQHNLLWQVSEHNATHTQIKVQTFSTWTSGRNNADCTNRFVYLTGAHHNIIMMMNTVRITNTLLCPLHPETVTNILSVPKFDSSTRQTHLLPSTSSRIRRSTFSSCRSLVRCSRICTQQGPTYSY